MTRANVKAGNDITFSFKVPMKIGNGYSDAALMFESFVEYIKNYSDSSPSGARFRVADVTSIGQGVLAIYSIELVEDQHEFKF